MIICKLNTLLAERNLKITKIAKDTGISRTTLTSLANNYSQGIQFETLNTLCMYLNINPKDFFEYIPFDFYVIPTFEVDDVNFSFINLSILIKENLFSYTCKLFFEMKYSEGILFLKLVKVDNLNEFKLFYTNLTPTLLIFFEYKLFNEISPFTEETFTDYFYSENDKFLDYTFNWNYINNPNSHKL